MRAAPSRAIGALLLLLAARPASPADEDAGALARRYFAWRGGAAFERLRSVHEQGRLTTSGLTGDLEIWAMADGRRWERDSVENIVTTEGISATRAWRSNLSGQIVPLDAADARARRREAQALFAGILDAGPPPRRKADETLDGQSWRVLEVSFPGQAFDFFLSDAGALHAVRIAGSGGSRITRYDDWRLVDGVRLPFGEQAGGADGDMRSVTRIALNRAPPPAAARPPRDRVRTIRTGSGSSWIPFRLFAGNRIYLPLAVNGRTFEALLDSGAETTVIDGAAARALGLHPLGQMQVEGSGGSAASGLATGVALSVGPERLSPVTVTVMDLGPIARALDIPLQAILGQEVFAAFVVDIDFRHRRIALRDPARFRAPRGAIRLPLVPAGGDRATLVSVEGRPPIRVYLDLGNGSPLDLFPAYWQTQHLLDGRRSSELLNGGAGGQRPVKVATVRALGVGGTVFHDVPTNFPPPGATTADTKRVEGNLGLPILSRFRVMADFRRNALYLLPEPGAAARPFDKDRTGLSIVRDGNQWRVIFVAPGSPGEAAGLKAGDRIAAIDGADAAAPSASARWRYGPAGRRLSFTLADHRAVTLTLRDYF